MKSKRGAAGGGGNGSTRGEFDSFLSELAGAVAERVQALNPKTASQADPVFFDETKTIVEWPERSAYVIEELR
ncbi:MAG: hypothetical protein WEA80_13220 [Gemmatimonadaceae bacterium]